MVGGKTFEGARLVADGLCWFGFVFVLVWLVGVGIEVAVVEFVGVGMVVGGVVEREAALGLGDFAELVVGKFSLWFLVGSGGGGDVLGGGAIFVVFHI